jgi:PAS domain S-box-containing protein
LRRAFRDQPAILGRALELIELTSAELDGTVASAYKSARDERSRTAETKYHALFENASEAILSFSPGDGHILELNAQCERLLGQSRAVLLQRTFAELFAPEYTDQARWLSSQEGGANLRLEDMAVCRADGLTIPISLSCNWVEIEGAAIAQVIMRDVTPLRQVQRELQLHAEQLEARVASRTAELKNSEERYRALFLQEQRRAQHLSLINDVQQCALVTRDVDEFLHQVAAAVQLHFRDCDVTFYLCRAFEDAAPAGLIEAANRDGTSEGEIPETALGSPRCGDLVVAAQVGGYGMAQPLGTSHPLTLGLPGFAATNGALLVISNDTTIDSRYARAPGVHRDALAQMCVPVAIEGEIAGVIAVSGDHPDTFDPRDAVALQTASTIVAAHLQASQMFREMAELKEFNETLVGTMLHSLMVVSRDGIVQVVNNRLSQTLRAPRAELINHPISEILGEAFTHHDLQQALDNVTENGASVEIPEVRIWSRGAEGTHAEEFIFDLRLSRVFFRGQAHAVFLLINLTQRWRKTQQLQLMNEMGRFLQSSLEVNTVLRTVLTCITAGPALGFNRAFLLLLSDDGTLLKGAMALGPSSAEEASIIWHEMGRRALSLQDILSDNNSSVIETPLQRDIVSLQIPLDAAVSPAVSQSVRERRALKVSRAQFVAAPALTSALPVAGAATSTVEIDRTQEEPTPASTSEQRTIDALQRTRAALSQIFTASEAVVAPLVAKTRIVGVVVADNLYSGAPIEDDDVSLLETVAQQAGLTVDNALTYQALHEAQRELVSAERLVAVGEMAARVSHEIRNPLATIGGWARSILKKPEDSESVKRKVSIITDEVERLEELLSDLLDMARPSEIVLAPCSVNELVEHAILLAEADVKAAGVEIERQLALDIPLALLDRRRILQALLNTLRNGAQSMTKGGVLTVITRLKTDAEEPDTSVRRVIGIEIRDTGVGIPERALKQIFDPFFSTKVSGSGLGLAVTLRIIRDHGGTIDVFPNEGGGTCFVMNLPLQEPPAESDVALTSSQTTDTLPASKREP